jgi:asparagine synthase (glutamine-hydrolysing)
MPAHEPLCLGQPRFADPELADLMAREGAPAAWRRAFERHGAEAPARAEGDFAVAIRLDDGRSFLAVDRFAVQTLCYTVRHGELCYAARADELATGSADLDPQSIFDYLYFHVIPSPATVFAGVLRVPAGHCVTVREGQATVAPFWTPHFTEGNNRSFESLRTEFLAHVEHSVADRILPGKTGCYLSGGTDSSTVAGILTRLTGSPAESFSIGFDVPGYDEMEYARIAVRHFGTRHHEYYITPDDLVAGMPQVAASYDQPFGNSSAVPAYYCARMAREAGLERLLAGDGGDELFGGNTRYAKQKVFGAYDGIPLLLRKAIAEPITDSGLLDPLPLLKKGASYVRQARVPMPDRMQTYNLLDRVGLGEILTPGFLARIDPEHPRRHQRDAYQTCPPTSLVNKMLAYDWRYTLAENDLPKVIGSARLAGINVGFPLLDDRLLDFSLQLPSHYKVKGLKLRWFFKEALRGFLPDAILTKKKHGFGLPFGPWAIEHAGLGSLSRDALQSLAARGLVRGDFTARLFKDYLPAHPGFYGELVWILTMLELWLQAKAPAYRADA